LNNVGGELLRKVLRENFVSKCLVTTGAGLEIAYRPVEVSELVIRTLLTAPVRDGGLVGRIPQVVMEPPRQVSEETAPAVIWNQVEYEAGQRALARHAPGSERLREEIEAGQRALAKYR
jgi:hypothetical protein